MQRHRGSIITWLIFIKMYSDSSLTLELFLSSSALVGVIIPLITAHPRRRSSYHRPPCASFHVLHHICTSTIFIISTGGWFEGRGGKLTPPARVMVWKSGRPRAAYRQGDVFLKSSSAESLSLWKTRGTKSNHHHPAPFVILGLFLSCLSCSQSTCGIVPSIFGCVFNC